MIHLALESPLPPIPTVRPWTCKPFRNRNFQTTSWARTTAWIQPDGMLLQHYLSAGMCETVHMLLSRSHLANSRTHAHIRTWSGQTERHCACLRAPTHPPTHTHTHAHTRTPARTYARAHTRTRARTHTHTHTRACLFHGTGLGLRDARGQASAAAGLCRPPRGLDLRVRSCHYRRRAGWCAW